MKNPFGVTRTQKTTAGTEFFFKACQLSYSVWIRFRTDHFWGSVLWDVEGRQSIGVLREGGRVLSVAPEKLYEKTRSVSSKIVNSLHRMLKAFTSSNMTKYHTRLSLILHRLPLFASSYSALAWCAITHRCTIMCCTQLQILQRKVWAIGDALRDHSGNSKPCCYLSDVRIWSISYLAVRWTHRSMIVQAAP